MRVPAPGKLLWERSLAKPVCSHPIPSCPVPISYPVPIPFPYPILFHSHVPSHPIPISHSIPSHSHIPSHPIPISYPIPSHSHLPPHTTASPGHNTSPHPTHAVHLSPAPLTPSHLGKPRISPKPPQNPPATPAQPPGPRSPPPAPSTGDEVPPAPFDPVWGQTPPSRGSALQLGEGQSSGATKRRPPLSASRSGAGPGEGACAAPPRRGGDTGSQRPPVAKGARWGWGRGMTPCSTRWPYTGPGVPQVAPWNRSDRVQALPGTTNDQIGACGLR